MTLRLAGFFRQSLSLHAERKVTLGRELDLVREFLAIEQVRFGERLRFEAEVTPDAGACLVPPMLLQPLVENAVKHGIGQMIEPGRISIHAARAGSLLRIGVENDVDPDTPCVKGTGVGLENVRRRLAAAYGIEASTHWSRDGARFRVELSLPAMTEQEE
jgi:LytS/YehU family sensor histidine kinase